MTPFGLPVVPCDLTIDIAIFITYFWWELWDYYQQVNRHPVKINTSHNTLGILSWQDWCFGRNGRRDQELKILWSSNSGMIVTRKKTAQIEFATYLQSFESDLPTDYCIIFTREYGAEDICVCK